MASSKPVIIINDNYDEDDLPHPYTSRPISEVQLKPGDAEELDRGSSWLVVVAAFFSMALIFGVELTFGVYAVAYKEAFEKEESEIAWIGSVSYGVMFLIGPLASILISRVGTSIAMAIAGGLCSLGYGASYFAQDAYHLYITFGLLVGLGMGIAFLCCYAVLPSYFKKYLRVASIIVTIGGGVGIFLFNAVFSFLIEEYGWRGSMLINAGICLHLFVFALIMKSARPDPSVRKPTISQVMGIHVLSNIKFRIYLIHILLWNIGFMIIFSLLQNYVMEKGGLTFEEAMMIGMFSGILNTLGRIASVPIERFFAPLKVYVAAACLMGFFETLIAAGWSQIGFAIPASAAGFFFGMMVCYLVPVLGDIVGFDSVTPALGYSNFMQGIGGLIGTPLLALLAGGSKFIVGGAITMTSGLVMGYAALRHLGDVKRSLMAQDSSAAVLNGDHHPLGYGKSTNDDEPGVKYSRNANATAPVAYADDT